jgi:ferrous iron transport protein B
MSSPTATPIAASAPRRLALVGNPNVGKSVLFGLLTGQYVVVSNYPGTTVEVTTGATKVLGASMPVVDTPGTNSLIPQSDDERVTRDFLLEDADTQVIQVADAKNLPRALTLSLQLAETGRPFLLCLNMMDEALDRGIEIDVAALADRLGVPVVVTTAIRRQGFDGLCVELPNARASTARVNYGEAIERGVEAIEALVPNSRFARRSLALMILAGDRSLTDFLQARLDKATLDRVEALRRQVQSQLSEPVGYVMQRARQAACSALLEGVFRGNRVAPDGLGAKLGRWAMHPVWSLPMLVAVLAIAYLFVGDFGAGVLVDLVENGLFNRFLNPWAIQAADFFCRFPHVHQLGEHGQWTSQYALSAGAALSAGERVARTVHDFLVGDYGIITMALTYSIAIVLPVVATFFLFFGVLEDSGYLPRLTVTVDRVFRIIGLNGKAVLPMVLGLGCDTMATLTTRILETKKERIVVTLLLALSVPCSAQLGVVMAMLSGVSLWGVGLWLGVVFGSIGVVGLLARFVIPGSASDFVMELPPMRRPKLSNVGIKTMARVEWYLREAVPLFMLGTLLLMVLDQTGALAAITRIGRPVVVGALGLPEEATRSFILGFLRRDYGAAGLFAMQRAGHLDSGQVVVALSVITLFVPCVANFFMMWKERGVWTSLGMVAFILPFAVGTGALLRFAIATFGIPV